MNGQDTYTTAKVFTYPNAVIRVFSPDLTEEERTNRMKQIHKAAANLLTKKQ